MVKVEAPPTAEENWAEHERTYRGFVKGVVIFTAHVFVILLILAWVFADSFNVPPVTS
jgi:Bacterial aa3 type cytochrome c oxidase subunit IV